VAPGSRIVLDANILIRAVLGRRFKKIITEHAEHAELFAPEVAYAEAERHLPEILTKHDRADQIDEAPVYGAAAWFGVICSDDRGVARS
jgi:predicted nucleic acid-binding protein